MKILVTGLVPKNGLKELYNHFDVTYANDKGWNRSDILNVIEEFDGLLLMGMKADKELIDAGKNLKIISVNGVGFDNVDIQYAKSKNIIVSNSPQAVLEPTAELTMCLMLAAARRIGNYDRNIRNGIWQNVSKPSEMGFCLYGSTLGILGMGRIGKGVAKRAITFGMKIIYSDSKPLPKEEEESLCAKYVTFDELLAMSDVVTIHAPLLESTRHLFNDETFGKMKKGSFLVNAARGPIVEEKALIKALTDGTLAGAGLDVFENEPTISKELLALENVMLTPHAGTGCLSSRTILAEEASQNIISFFIDKKPIKVVNK